MSAHRKYAIFGLACATLVGCASLARHSGQEDARRDIAGGVLANERYGLPVLGIDADSQVVLSSDEYSQFLREHYGIELRFVAGCIVSERIRAHAAGYNEVMDVEIGRRFGTNVWHQSWEDAYKPYAARHANAQTHQ
jgi:hypothetical protein